MITDIREKVGFTNGREVCTFKLAAHKVLMVLVPYQSAGQGAWSVGKPYWNMAVRVQYSVTMVYTYWVQISLENLRD